MSRLAPALGVAAAVALAAAILAASARGSPVPVGGVENTDAAAIVFVLALGVAFALYAGGLLVLRRRGARLAVVCAIAAGIQLIPIGGPLLLSHDVYSYWAYARIESRHDSDPYRVPPAGFPADPATQKVAPGWRRTTSVYGPAFTAFSIGVDRVTQNPETVALVFRIVAALAAIGATLLAACIARRRAFAAAFVGWNPLLAVSFAGGGHNDALMLVLMLGALTLGARQREASAGALWILAAAVKAPALLLLPLQLARAGRRFWIGCAAVGAAGCIAATLAFGSSWLTAFGRLGRNESRFATPARLEQLGVPDRAAHLLAVTALVIGALWLFRQARRGRPRLALGACLLALTTPWLLPWYSSWPVALAAVEEDRTAQILALCVTAYLLTARVPF